MSLGNGRWQGTTQLIILITEMARQQRQAHAGACCISQGRKRIDPKHYPRVFNVLIHPLADHCRRNDSSRPIHSFLDRPLRTWRDSKSDEP